MKRVILTAAVATAMTVAVAGAATAGVTVYTSAADFALATAITNLEDFDCDAGLGCLSAGVHPASDLARNGIDFAPTSTNDLFIAAANSGYFVPSQPTAVLTADGDEDFRISLHSGATFNAIGLDFITNRYGAPTVSLYGASGLIGAYTLTQPADSYGFFGITSTESIHYVTTQVDRGYLLDTAVDNVRIGGLSAAPEPASWALMLLGFGGMGAVLRSRRADFRAA